MGKRYYCTYCDKTMVDTPMIIKTHNKGVVHQKLVNEHYQQFKDPETILHEESSKNPCHRFIKGECKFGSICHYSHYTKEQLDALRNYVASKNQTASTNNLSFEDLYAKLKNDKSATQSNEEETVLYDNNGFTHIFPWTYSQALESYDSNLPPSIRKLCIEDFTKANITEWG